MTNTVMATNGRKGTFLVLTALERNPDVFVHEQLFSNPPESRNIFVRGLTGWETGERCFDRKLLDVPSSSGIVLPCAPGMVEPTDEPSFWSFVDSRPDIQLLHMRRRNLLKAYVSGQVASITGIWSNRYPTVTPEPAVRVDPKAAANYIKWDLKASIDAQERYKDRPNMVVFYEDLAADVPLWLERIQQFLQIPVVETRPRTRKQATRKLATAVSNYDELREAWKGTELEQYFDE